MKQGWEIKKLDEVCTIKGRIGYRGYTKQDLVEEGEGAISLSPSNIKDNQIIYKNCTYISWFKYDESPEIKIFNGDIIYCKTASIGKIALIDNLPEKATINPQFVVLKELKCSNKYLFFFMNSREFKEQEREIIGGTAIPTLSQANLGNLKIPLPPLTEQQRIVSILDEAFAAIAKAKANAEQNLKNAKELFESYLQGVFENKSEGWEEKTLGDVCNIIGGGTPSKTNSKFYNGDIYWATVRDMKGQIISETEHKITKDAVKNSSTNIIPKGNVIIATRVGLGKICLLEHDTAINQDLKGVIPINHKIISVEFLYRWLKSISQKIIEEGTGATVQGVKLPFIKSLKIYLPSIKEQETIIKKLNALSEETQKLESIYQQKINDLEELKKSILQKAFTGDLKTAKALV